MRSPIGKPRVFISYARKDLEFIQRLETDLRAAHCEPWRDEIEIRVGQPWLDEIFSNGMPSCEVVLCYITENSLQSEMVKREIDARVIARLHDEYVHFLPYLAGDSIRPQLRLDLQTLHAPLLNEQNYGEALPRLIAEIWRCYTESLVAQATQVEKGKRLEAEARVRELGNR